MASEWKQKLETAEKEWSRKLTESDERSVMAVAQAKQEMHEQLERSEETIQKLRQKLKSLENEGMQAIMP